MKYPITIIFLLLSISVFSQREILYDLNSYKQVEFNRSELVFTPNGGVSASDQINVEGRDADFIFKAGSEAIHSKYINSAKEQYTLIQSARFNIADGFEIAAKRKVAKRSYTGNEYKKLGYSSEGSFDTRRNQNFGVKNDLKLLNLEGDLGFGFGRLEFVNHAWSAIQILQALENNGLLLKFPSHDEITNFADLIGTVRTNRILDFRLRNIEILETTIEYLIDKQFIDELSTLAILIIGDTYQYDQIIGRNAGSRLEFTFAPAAEFLKQSVQLFSPIEQLVLKTIGRIEHVSINNIDVKWMKTRSYGAILEFNNKYEYYDNQVENRTTKTAQAGLTYDYGYRYLPNLRNNFNINLESSLFMDALFPKDAPTEYSGARLSARLITGYRHFFSPYTQFSANGFLIYNDFEFQAGEFQPAITAQVNFGITHAIF